MAQSENIFTATDTNFDQEVLKSGQLTIIDFWAEWCGPCRALGPTIETLANEYKGKVKIYKMNVDENPQTPAKFNIRSIPTIVFLKNGELVDQLLGNQPKENFSRVIDRHLA